jgi:H+/Cl- antiporter ClcA
MTLGIAAPRGLLVPYLAIGGAYGRFIGQLLKSSILPDANLHTFALIGAASFLGGSARMTISLCVILIETTGSVARGLPIMVTLMVAKWVGDWFSHENHS